MKTPKHKPDIVKWKRMQEMQKKQKMKKKILKNTPKPKPNIVLNVKKNLRELGCLPTSAKFIVFSQTQWGSFCISFYEVIYFVYHKTLNFPRGLVGRIEHIFFLNFFCFFWMKIKMNTPKPKPDIVKWKRMQEMQTKQKMIKNT